MVKEKGVKEVNKVDEEFGKGVGEKMGVEGGSEESEEVEDDKKDREM